MTELKRIRESRGLSQRELALRTRISLRTLQAFEQGARDICSASAESVLDLALVLDVNPYELLYGVSWYSVTQERRMELLR